MKRFVITAVLALFGMSAMAWNHYGHASIARIAEKHVAPSTKAALDRYLDGDSITSIASDADVHYYEWWHDIGFECSNPKILRRVAHEPMDSQPANIEPWCHSYTVDSLFNVYRTNREGDVYVRNCIMDLEELINDLKKRSSTMDKEERRIKISVLVHLMGDFHCPYHTLYVPASPTGGKYSLRWGDKKVCAHNVWDYDIFAELGPGWTYNDFADAADTATPAERAKVTEGFIYEWGKASAIDSYAAHKGEPGPVHDAGYLETLRPLLYNQLRNAGYRLAVVLDYLFEN